MFLFFSPMGFPVFFSPPWFGKKNALRKLYPAIHLHLWRHLKCILLWALSLLVVEGMCWTGLVSSLVATGVVPNSICVGFSLWAPWLWKLPHRSVFSNLLLSHCLLSGTICIDYSISKRLQGDCFVYFAYPYAYTLAFGRTCLRSEKSRGKATTCSLHSLIILLAKWWA